MFIQRRSAINHLVVAATFTFTLLTVPFAAASAAEIRALDEFDGGNGTTPLGGLLRTRDGTLLGTAKEGGKTVSCVTGCGTVYSLGPQGRIAAEFKLPGDGRLAGRHPHGPLFQAKDGWIYGTASLGGAVDGCDPEGCGTIFRMKVGGIRSTVALMSRESGSNPHGALVQGKDGHLYGTASHGGAFTSCISGSLGCGTVFRLRPDGVVTPLVNFNGENGALPSAQLVIGPDGHLYGTTTYGGQFNAGTVFRVSPKGVLTTLMSFEGGGQGDGPFGGLTLGPDGHLYGVTTLGGAHNNGTIFRITRQGAFTLLHSFDGAGTGSRPYSPLTTGRDGKLYGTANQGGTWDRGTAYSITTVGQFQLLANFDAFSNVNFPMGRLLETEDGVFLGLSHAGAFGSVYELRTNPAGH